MAATRWSPSLLSSFLAGAAPASRQIRRASSRSSRLSTATATATATATPCTRLRTNGPYEKGGRSLWRQRDTIVACNVSVSAGASSSSSSSSPSILLGLLSDTHRHCRELSLATAKADDGGDVDDDPQRRDFTARSVEGDGGGGGGDRPAAADNGNPTGVAVVHAFCDPVYDRSSFHLAGGASLVAPVAARLALRAHHELLGTCGSDGGGASSSSSRHEVETHPHPSVGIVDHISVMPMSGDGERSDEAQEAASEAAKEIGRQLERGLSAPNTQPSVLPRILYYGGADPQGASLEDVRRHRTNFFQSSRPSNSSHVHVNVHAELTQAAAVASSTPSSTAHNDTRTLTSTVVVGAPERFVENWNVRVSSNCPRHLVTALTRRVRALRGGDGRWVEALTLPTSHGQWEVACNLLHPQLVSAQHVDECARAWLLESATSTAEPIPPSNRLIVKSYRVGTTEKQCWEVLRSVSRSNQDRTRHDECVMEQFRTHLDSS